MKKLITLLSVIAFGFGANAQDYKPAKGTITTELSLVGGFFGDFGLRQTTEVAKPALKFRYFLKDDVALRLGFSASRKSSKNTVDTTTETTGVASIPTASIPTNFNSESFFGINLGVEKHFKGSDRLSTYLGADLLIGSSRNFDENTNSSNGNSNSLKNDRTKDANFSFGIGFLTGADYYIAKKVYIGAELGLSMVTKSKKDEVDTTVVGAITTIKTTTFGDGDFNIDTQLNGGIRLGYQF